MNQKRVTPLDDPTARAALEGAAADSDAVPSANPLMQNLQVDVGLRVGRNTWVRNLDGNVEVYTPEGVDPLRIRMNVEEPGLSLDGVINADRGEYTFAGRVFEMTTGSVTFVPGTALDPLLQLNALYEVPRRGREALVIQIHLTGTLSQPRIALASNSEPPMSESDLLSYLAFGQSSSSVLNLSDAGLSGGGSDGGGIGAMAQQQLATLALGGVVDQAFSNLERTGSRALDIFRVHPAELPEELAFDGQLGNFLRGTEVVAGKYLTSRLFLAVEGRTTTEAWPGFRVEYTQEDGFSWVMTWEPTYLPVQPSLEMDQSARSTRVFGTFLFWSRRF
jgi:translocation and assembly module TamB